MAHLEAELFKSMRERLRSLDFALIFDIGANVGQSTIRFRSELPEAEVWAFEPVRATFEEFSNRFRGDQKVRPFQLAFGAGAGEATMIAEGTSVGNRIVASVREGLPSETVKVARGDDFLAEYGMPRVNYLKIDAEGHDLQVLQGFRRAMAEHQIDMVQMEVGLNPRNAGHVTFEKVKATMEAFHYSLFGVTDVTFET